eukprot:3710361-Amphidinium_carterae.1
MYKWIRGSAIGWDLALHGDDTAGVELRARSKLWQPGCVRWLQSCLNVLRFGPGPRVRLPAELLLKSPFEVGPHER